MGEEGGGEGGNDEADATAERDERNPDERGRDDPDRDDLAAIVDGRDTGSAIAALREEGVFDPTRSVEPYDGDRMAVPVAVAPSNTAVEDVVPVDLSPRVRGLEDLLAARGFTDAEIDAAPSSWAVVGSVVLVDFGDVSADDRLDDERRNAVGEALLELHGEADTVLARGGVSGTRREPDVEVVAGSGETETVHVEHGTRYALDLSRVMFAPGNEAERVRMGEVGAAGERVFDMFAGVGYFSLPMARTGAEVTAAEINPEAYRLLVENAMLNGVEARLHAVLGDCSDVETTADRVVMGHYEAHEHLDAALEALVSGGTVHLHEATPEDLFPARPVERLEDAAAVAGRDVDVLETSVVKSHSAGVVHGVVDARVD